MTEELCEDSDSKKNMSETLHPNYQDILTEHYHLFSKYLYAEDFVDELISKAVLSPNDKEIILNQYVNQTRRQRATKLVDVLLTKGPKGYDCFIEMLEFQYPHVYKEVTQREPRPLPRGAQRNRHSDRLLLLENLPNLAHHIREQFRQNEELSMQLSVLEGLMKDSQVEKAELEKENEMLKSDATEKTSELSAQKSLANKLQADVNKLHEDLKNEMERSHQIRDERDDLKQQLQDLRIERSQSKVKKEPAQGSRFPAVPGREAHIVEQNKIYRDQLEEQIRHAEDLADRLCRLEDHALDLEKQVIKLKTQLHKDEKEKKLLEKEKAELKKKNETYSDRLKQKNEELLSIENQKLKAEGQIREMKQDSEKQQQKIDELEEQLQQAQNELERLKLRLSRSSQEMSSSAEEGQEEGLERRKNIKGSYNGGKYTEKLQGRNGSEGADSDSDLERQLDSSGGADLKSSTLPPPGKFSPERIFQSEVAHFRWTIREHKNKRKQKVEESESMVVEVPGSMKRKPQMCGGNRGYAVEDSCQQFQGPDLTFRDVKLAAMADIQNLQPTELMLQDDTPGRVSGPVVHSEDSEDVNENKSTVSSESSEPLRARKPASQPSWTLIDSGPYATVDPVRPHRNVRAICVSTELSDFPSHDVYSVLLPRSCSVVKHSGFEASSITVTVKQPILNDKFEIIGGNHTGIFISKVNKTCEVVTGDQIKEIIYTPSDRAEPVTVSLQGCTLDEVHNLLSQDWVRPKKEKEVKLSLGKFHPEYDSAKKWIAENGGTGDYFYIRCNYEKNTQQQGLEGTILKPGEIFLVRNTRCEQQLWSGYKVNEITGDRAQQETKIYNKNWTYQGDLIRARRKLVGVINRAHSHEKGDGEDGDKRHLAFKFRGQVYERVLPMKASVKLPVILFGSDPLVEAMMNLISNNLGLQFTVENYDELSDPDSFELYRQDSHSVWKGKLDKVSSSQRHIQKIIFLLKITSETAISALQGIFGSGFSVTVNENTISQGTYIKEKLGEKGLQIEELCFPEITSKERLLSKFHACVQSSQDRILWLSPSEMETSVAEKYLTYLGQDLSNVMTSVQNAQSQDFGSDC